jgi:TolB-like protein
MKYKNMVGIVLLGVLLLASGCGSGSNMRTFMRPDTSLAHIQSVAVLPFEGSENTSRMREFTMTQVLATGLFDVVDKGRIDSFLLQEGIVAGQPLDLPTMRRLGQIVKAEALMFGSVEQATQSRGNAQYEEITMTLRLLDAETGTLLWQASGVGSGYSLADRMFGMAPKDNFQVTMDLLGRLLSTIR